MCGIVGYVGKRSAQDVLLDGLEKLEYRGYDSAGVALALDGGICGKSWRRSSWHKASAASATPAGLPMASPAM